MTPADRHALAELDSRIAVMEKRLRNAKAARDSYIDFLKSKYPMYSFPHTTSRTYKTDDVFINRLATSEYNWDEEWDRRTRVIQPSAKLRLHEQIPNSGPLLVSDMERVRHRLTDIARQLRSLRETGLNLSTEDYLRTRFQFSETSYNDTDMILAIRNRLSDMSFTSFEPLATPTAAEISVMKFGEQRDAYIADLRAGRVKFDVAESEKPTISSSSNLQDSQRPERPENKRVDSEERPTQSQDNAIKNEPAGVQQNASDEDETKRKTKVETVPVGGSAPTSPPPSIPKSSAYEQMIGIFGHANASDTDDDSVVSTKPVTVHENPNTTAVVRKSAAEQKGAGSLSQYLTTNTKPDVPTSSDSDDDFFK